MARKSAATGKFYVVRHPASRFRTLRFGPFADSASEGSLATASIGFVVQVSRFPIRMWCSTCQQDVPALGAANEGTLCCGKCGGALAAPEAKQALPGRTDTPPFPQTASETAALEKLLRAPPLSNEDWAIEAELRGVQRLLGSLKTHRSELADRLKPPAPHVSPAHWKKPEGMSENAGRAARSRDKSEPRAHVAAWTILSIGLAVFACGSVLLGWSFLAKRDDLWPIGMPLTLIGQAGLILGLVLQLDGLWNSNRQTAEVLSELDGELKSVREATTLLSTSHSSSAQSFYLHLAEGASPQLLLADLKGQMDLLAQQMAKQARS